MIYLDNAATSFPKPAQVARAMAGTLAKIGGNPGRSGHLLAMAGSRVMEKCREEAAAFFGLDRPEQVIFTFNCTDSLNMAIRGVLHTGDHVLCTYQEHNAVMRVLKGYESRGMITLTVLQPDGAGVVHPETVRAAITPKTALAVFCHAGNVTGVVQPVAALGKVCRERGIPVLADAAQSAGVLGVDAKALNADMIALPGHKGLLGPHGTGLLLLPGGLVPAPFREGGTGSASESMLQPELLPDALESGTANLPGIAGLLQGIRFVKKHREEIAGYEAFLADGLREMLADIPGVALYGQGKNEKVGVVSFNVGALDSGQAADLLGQQGFALRGGLHCAPSVHAWLGTLERGAVRASVGIYNTREQTEKLAMAVKRLALGAGR